MTSDPTAAAPGAPITQPPSTAGMTTKVVKGSLWTLGGQVLPMMVAFVSTPFVIRFLGSEAYGVLLLVGLIPTYFAFADFGMGMASTKFASEAFGQGDRTRERYIIWTAASVAAVSALAIAIPIFLFSNTIVAAMNVPGHLLAEADVALKIASATFVFGILANVLNSPMLARLRMDMNTVTTAVPKVLLAAVTPIVLYCGFGITGAVSWAFIVGICGICLVLYFAGRLLPGVLKPAFDRGLLRPLLKFGGAWFVAMIAAMLLVNLEKLFLTKMVSVQALAYYSVAFTFANIAGLFSQAMIQSLIPAFSQLASPEKRSQLEGLFSRSLRLNLIFLLPVVAMLIFIARPFFSIWAGEEFARESAWPSYILLAGLFFNVLAFTPHSAIIASGRSDIFARLYWLELTAYILLALLLISNFGIVGAAAAWSIRVVLDSIAQLWLARRATGISLQFSMHFIWTLLAGIVLVPAVFGVLAYGYVTLPLIGLAMLSLAIYGIIVWKASLLDEERNWARNKVLRTVMNAS